MLKIFTLLIFLSPSILLAQELLQPGKSIQKKLLIDEKHSYSFNMKEGECATIIVMQKGVDVAVDVISPSGQKMKTIDSSDGEEGEEPVYIEASREGEYKIIVYPFIGEWTEENKKIWQVQNPGKSRDSFLLAQKWKIKAIMK